MTDDPTVPRPPGRVPDVRELVVRLFVPPSPRPAGGRPDRAAIGRYLAGGWRRGADPNRWFAGRFYAAASGAADVCPLIHFVREGAAAGVPPHPWVDLGWFARRYLDEPAPSAFALVHLLETGLHAGHVPHPALDEPAVAARLTAVEPDAREGVLAAIIAERQADPRPAMALIDAGWYRSVYPDVARAGVDPVRHYLETGWREGRDPNLWFSTSLYLAQQPAVAAEGICPILHYVQRGAAAGAEPRHGFRADWYARRYLPSGRAADALAHFLAEGATAGCVPHPVLDRAEIAERVAATPPALRLRALADLLDGEEIDDADLVSALVDRSWYRARYPDVPSHVDCAAHYRRWGWKEGREPNAWFSSDHYRAQAHDLDVNRCPLEHFVEEGAAAGHDPDPAFAVAWYSRRHLGWTRPRAEALRHFLRVGLAAGLAPHPDLDGPGAAARLAMLPEAERPGAVRMLAALVGRAGLAGVQSDVERERLWSWLARLVAPGAEAVLLVGPPPERGGLELAGAAALALPQQEVAILAAARADGDLVIASDAPIGPIVVTPATEPALLAAFVRTTRCTRAALLGRWPGATALARALRDAGLAVAVAEA